MLRIKIQKIEDGKKETLADYECKSILAFVAKEDNVVGQIIANLSDADIADIMMSSPHMMEIHKMITAYEIAKHLGMTKDPEDELADRIGGPLQ